MWILCFQTFIPCSLHFLEISCGCQTEVREAAGPFQEESPHLGKASLATRWDWKGI